MKRWIACLAACSALGIGPCGPGGSSENNNGGMGPPPSAPRPTGLDPVPPVVLECRSGPEPSWQVSLGSVPGLNACTGSLLVNLGPLLLETSVPAGAVSAIAGGPTVPDWPKECGPGCALSMEETLVVVPNKELITIFKGHTQTRFGWSAKSKAWEPEPYVYVDLIGYQQVGGALTPVTEATSPGDFANVEVWIVWDRDGGNSVYKRSGEVYKIAERNDPLSAMDKRAGAASPRGRAIEYVRGQPGDYLKEIHDYRFKDGIIAVVIHRRGEADPSVEAGGTPDPALIPDFGLVEYVGYDAVTDGDSVAHAKGWFKFDYDATGRLASVAVDATDPSGVTFRNPTTLEYDGTTGARVNKITDGSGDVKTYSYRDGRVQQLVHLAQTASENESLTFNYVCGGGAWCGPTVAPLRFTETDEDGYLRTTDYADFPQATPTGVYVSQIARGTMTGTGGRIDEASTQRTWRDGTGTLRLRWRVAQGTVESWNTDGHPANACSSYRVDRDVDPDDAEFLSAAIAGYVPEKSVSELDYEVRCYDGDNLLVRSMSPAGRQEITYFKDEHPDPKDAWWQTYGWASLMPAKVVVKTKDAMNQTVTTEAKTMVETAAGSPCLTAAGLSLPSLPDVEFVLCGTSPLSGGAQVVVLDRWMRVAATSTPQDIDFKTTTYDLFGNSLVTTDPTGARKLERQYSPAGYLVDEQVSVCGTVVTHQTHDEKPTLVTTTETAGGVTTTNKVTLGAGTGRIEQRELVTPGYTKTQWFTFSPKGDVVTGRTDIYTQTVAPDFVGPPQEYSREEWAWTVRGYR